MLDLDKLTSIDFVYSKEKYLNQCPMYHKYINFTFDHFAYIEFGDIKLGVCVTSQSKLDYEHGVEHGVFRVFNLQEGYRFNIEFDEKEYERSMSNHEYVKYMRKIMEISNIDPNSKNLTILPDIIYWIITDIKQIDDRRTFMEKNMLSNLMVQPLMPIFNIKG